MRLLRSLWYVLTLRCEEADRVRTSVPEGQRQWHEAVGERIHSVLCSSCRHARRQIEIMKQTVEDMRASQEPGPGLSEAARERIGQRLERAAQDSE